MRQWPASRPGLLGYRGASLLLLWDSLTLPVGGVLWVQHPGDGSFGVLALAGMSGARAPGTLPGGAGRASAALGISGGWAWRCGAGDGPGSSAASRRPNGYTTYPPWWDRCAPSCRLGGGST